MFNKVKYRHIPSSFLCHAMQASDDSISGFQFRFDIDAIFAKYRRYRFDIDIL